MDKHTWAEKEGKAWLDAQGWLKDRGTFNNPPDPIRQTDEHEFISKFGRECIKYMEHRQLFKFKEGYLTAHIFWYSSYGVMMLFPSRWDTTPSGKHSVQWRGPILYYIIGCNHDFREIPSPECRERGIPHEGHCWHVVECKTCGYQTAYDSSG